MFLVVAIGLVSGKVFIYSYHQTRPEAIAAANRSRECISLHEFEIVDCSDVPANQWNSYVAARVSTNRFTSISGSQFQSSYVS